MVTKNLYKNLRWMFAKFLKIRVTRLSEHEHFLIVDSKVNKYVLPNTMLNFERLKNIIECLDYLNIRSIAGDYVECGVWKGGSVALASLYLDHKKVSGRSIHLFDAFGDICEPNFAIDGARAIKEVGGIERAQGRLQASGMYQNLGIENSSVTEVRNLFNKINYQGASVHFHVGWFQDTTPSVRGKIDAISLLRLDGDWYESTKVCLENLYELVTVGGIIIVDDYGAYEGCKKAVDEFLFSQGLSPYINKIDEDAIFWVKY